VPEEKKVVPLVSIVIPNYNYAHYLYECFKSIVYQDYQNIETIVVDDASTDNSWKIIMSANPQRAHRMPGNVGCSQCKNWGIKMAAGEFIALLDSDDMLTPGSIRRRVEKFQANPKLDMVHGRAWRWRDGIGKDGWNKKSRIHDQTVMVRREVFEKHGAFNPELRTRENKDLWLRWGVHPDSTNKPAIKAKKFPEFYALYRKHADQKHRKRKQK